MKLSVIRNSFGYVTGFDQKHQIVLLSEEIEDALVFFGPEQVDQFVADHVDKGHGLRSEDYKVIELQLEVIDVDSP